MGHKMQTEIKLANPAMVRITMAAIPMGVLSGQMGRKELKKRSAFGARGRLVTCAASAHCGPISKTRSQTSIKEKKLRLGLGRKTEKFRDVDYEGQAGS